jgi:hypothetical protein
VAELRQKIGVKGSLVALNDIDPQYAGAAVATFNKGPLGASRILSLSADTRIDSAGEVFCRDSNDYSNVFFSPNAEAAIGAMQASGIKVDTK